MVVSEQNNLISNSSNTGLMVYKPENIINKIWLKLKKFFRRGKLGANNEVNR